MSQPPIHILAVDDEPDLCALTKDFLEMSTDMEVDTVHSVREAMGALAKKSYDVIVSDYQMPGEDGIQFLKSLRGAGDQIPFILLTGKGREEVVIEALNNGADSYLQKGGKSVPMYTELEHRIRATVRRYRSENALRESEGKFRGFYDSIRDGIVRVAMDGTILECNHAYLELTGYTLEELEQLTYMDLTPEKWHDMEHGIISNFAMKTGHSEGYEKEYRRKDGMVFPISLRIWLILDEHGNPSHMWGIVRDITEIKLAEEALRQKTALLEAQVAASIDGILVIDENHKRVLVNQRIIELFNVPQQIIGDIDDNLLLKHVVSLTKCPEQFLEKVEYLYDHVDEASRDEIEFKDGMVLDRYSAPVLDKNGKYYGRTWTFREITESKRVENELRASQNMLSKILATSPNFVYIYDLKEHRNIYTNREVVDFLGYTSQQIESMGSSLFELILHPDDVKVVEEFQDRQRHLADGVIIEAEYRMRRADGNWCWLRSRNMVFERDPDGSVRSELGIAEDVTERKRAEKEVESSRHLHSKIMETSLNLVFIYDLKEHRNLYASRKMAEFLGYDPQQIQDLGSQLFEKILHPDDAKVVEEYQELLRNLDDGKIAELQYRLRRGDGNWCWIRSRNMVFERDPDGSVRSELGIAEDVTEKKLAEGELKAADLEIRKSKDMFRALIDRSYDAVIIHDMEGNILDVNATMLRLYQVTKEEALDYNIADFTGVACSMEEAQEHWEQALAGVDQFFPWQARRPKDGSVFDVEVYLTLITFDESHLILGNIRDITERKRDERALNEANRKLNLLSSITWHDINNQLMTLAGNLSLLDKGQLDDRSKQRLLKAEIAAERISAMIEFTKEYEHIGVNAPIWQDISTLVDRCAMDVHLGQIRIENDVPTGTEVFADPLISKVFYNLMDNAVQHGRNINTIRFYIEECDGVRAIICEDDGMGIPTDMKERLFTQGFGNDHGLGLFLSREILSITGITIKEIGHPGKGAKFIMVVPTGGFVVVRP
jgi:PAS domain S-box-containing protein